MFSHYAATSQLSTIHEILDGALDQHGGTLLVDGLSGMGKTFFLRQLAEEAAASEHWPVTYANADQIESGEPYSFFERFLAAGIALDWDFEPEVTHQPITVARQAVRYILDQPHSRGHIIIIDDAQWIDPESVRVLRHMIPRLNRRNVLIACGARTPHRPGSLGLFLQETATPPQDWHVELHPLNAEKIRALAYERFAVTISKRNAQKLEELSGGSYLGVDTLFNQITEEEIRKLHTTWDIPIRGVRLQNPLLAEYSALDEDTRAIADIVCVAGHSLTPAVLRTAVEKLDLPDAIDDALGSGIIRASDFGKTVGPRHELVAAAVRDTVPADTTRKIHQVLAELTEGFVSVRHLLKGAETWTPELKEHTDAYLCDARALSLVTNPSEVLRMALQLVDEPTQRQQLVTELVMTHIRAKTGYECLDLLPEVEAMPYSVLREFMAIVLRSYLVEEDFPRARVETLLTTAAETPDDRAVQAFLMFLLVLMTLRSPDYRLIPGLIPAAQELLAQGPQHPEELADERLAWMVTPHETSLVLEAYQLVAWQLDGNIAATSKALPTLIARVEQLADGAAKVDGLMPLSGAAMATGDVQLAHDLAAKAVHVLETSPGEPWAAATPRVILAHTLVLFGRYEEAAGVLHDLEEVSHEALDLEARLTGAALRATIETITGGHQVKKFLRHARRVADLDWEHYGRDLTIMAELELARTQHRHSDILAITSAPRLQDFANTQRGYLTFRAHALISVEKLDAAQDLIDTLQQHRGSRWFEYWGSLEWLQARLAQAHGQTTDAEQHYRKALQQRKFPLPWALAARDFGQFLVECNDGEAAASMLRKAIGVLKRIGASGYLPEAQARLQSAVGLTDSAQLKIWETITQREREVAELLAAGLSNRAIAQRLVISESTARYHVSNILRKLQLTSRAEVARLFQQLPAAPDASED